jgi:hypothetical protein
MMQTESAVRRSFVGAVTRLRREPLVWFGLLGGLLVLADAAWRAPEPSAVTVSPSVRRSLREEHGRRFGSPPTPDEEAALIRTYVDQEVLYREARRLGLDEADVIVRRRLVQKMEFLLEADEAIREPTDAELRAHLERYPQRFGGAERFSFSHVFADRTRRGASAEATAQAWLGALRAGADAASLGDAFVHGRAFRHQSSARLATAFGPGFPAQLAQAPPNTWWGPVLSSYGAHLVRVSAHVPASVPTLASVRTRVRADRLQELRAHARDAALARLRARYAVRIGADPAPALAVLP